jgi:hypothetical protein
MMSVMAYVEIDVADQIRSRFTSNGKLCIHNFLMCRSLIEKGRQNLPMSSASSETTILLIRIRH